MYILFICWSIFSRWYSHVPTTPHCPWHRWVRLCHWQCGFKLSGVIDRSESKMFSVIFLRLLYLLLWKIRHCSWAKTLVHEFKEISWHFFVYKRTDMAVPLTPRNKKFNLSIRICKQYFREIERTFENTSACQSGFPYGLHWGKKGRRKIPLHSPFKGEHIILFF